ncbi:MAG TPA: sterol desaturase family protein [Pirellulales bacterium]|jgi:sterol desaturase/sphingolipid hydroxylase (fatty acid hydroxylase superfamily)|nr:sterol desaturase family protein [Pirellulales bacterium]
MPLTERFSIALRAIPRLSLADAFWYVLLAGAAWVLLYVCLRRAWAHRKVVPKYPSRRQIAWELLLSLRSAIVFGLVGGFVVFAGYSGWTRLYVNIDRYGWPWFGASIAGAIAVHDAYFYWTHRLMHARWLFKRVHQVHHWSINPSPWAAYSFSTFEAFVQAGIGPLLVLILPMHPAAFLTFMLWQISFNVLGHCGYEIFPGWFLASPLGKLLNTPTHHALHHESFNANYGLYFNIWDRLMGTNDPHYESRFAHATGMRVGEV